MSCVYFIEGGGFVKIGRTTHLASRLRSLQAASPVPLTVAFVLEGGCDVETALHRHFAASRRHGEWFALPEGWIDEALEVADGVPAIDLTEALSERRLPEPPRLIRRTFDPVTGAPLPHTNKPFTGDDGENGSE